MGKNKFYKGLPGTIFKITKLDLCRWRVPGWYYILANFRTNRFIDVEIVRGDQNLTQTHTESCFTSPLFLRKAETRLQITERGGSVVTHETGIRDVPG